MVAEMEADELRRNAEQRTATEERERRQWADTSRKSKGVSSWRGIARGNLETHPEASHETGHRARLGK
jgi:hypothetical protein